MKAYLIALLMLLIPLLQMAQGVYTRQYNDVGNGSGMYRPVELPGGGFILNGNAHANFDADFLIARVDAQGNILWSRQYGDAGFDNLAIVLRAQDKGYLLAGETDGFPVNSGYKSYIIKTDSNGIAQWAKKVQYGQQSYIMDGDYTSDGGFILAGYGTYGAGMQFVITKMDSAGTVQWCKAYGALYNALPVAVRQTPDGGYVMAGSSGWNSYIVKTDSTGNLQWSRLMDEPNSTYERFNNVEVSSSGDIFVTESIPYGLYPNNNCVAIVKFDIQGNVQWSKRYTIGSSLSNGQLVSLSNGSCVVAASAASLSKSALFRLDPAGNVIWAKEYPAQYITGAVIKTFDGNYLMHGYYGVHMKVDTFGNSSCGSTPATLTVMPGVMPYAMYDTMIVVDFVDSLIPHTNTSYSLVRTDYCFQGGNSIDESEPGVTAVYPNPFNDHLVIEMSNDLEEFNLELYDQVGRKVLASETAHGSVTISTGDLAEGIYYYRAASGEKHYSGKVVLVR